MTLRPLGCTFLWLVIGCASTPTLRQGPLLPLHVGIVPAVCTILAEDGGQFDEGDLLEISLDIQGEELSRRLVTALQGREVVQATLLDYPEGTSAQEFQETFQPLQQRDYWTERAREQGVDAVLLVSLEYDPRIFGHANDWFWINHFIFVFGGPLCWLPDDRSYLASGRLTASIYDGCLVDREPRSLGEVTAEIASFQSSFPEVTLDLIDRSSGIGTYALGLVWPPGWLVVQNETVREEVKNRILDDLAGSVERQVHDRFRDIHEARSLVHHHFDLPTVRVERTSPESVSFSGDILLRTGAGVSRLDSIVIEADGHRTEIEPGETDAIVDEELTRTSADRRGPVLRYAIRADVPSTADHVRVTVVEGGQTRARRSVTFPVSRAGAPGM